MRSKTMFVPAALALLLAYVGPAAADHWEFRTVRSHGHYGTPFVTRVLVADAFATTPYAAPGCDTGAALALGAGYAGGGYGSYGLSAFAGVPVVPDYGYRNFGYRTFAVPTNQVFLGNASVFVTPGNVTVVGPHGGYVGHGGPWHGHGHH